MTRRNNDITNNLDILTTGPGASLLALMLALGACDVDEDLAATTTDLADSGEAPAGQALEALEIGDHGPEVAAAHEYLRRYGYFPNPELAAEYPGWRPVVDVTPEDPEVFDAPLAEALSSYQQGHGLPVTGKLDAATQALMQQPRCGFPDHHTPQRTKDLVGSIAAGGDDDGGAPFEGTLGLKDLKAGTLDPNAYKFSPSSLTFTDLTYGMFVPSGDVSANFQLQEITAATKTWSAAAPVVFSMRTIKDVNFSFMSKVHGDQKNFDNLTYAHGTTPNCSQTPGVYACYVPIHLNDESFTWGVGNGSTVQDIQTHALHELGHALGLAHSADSNAVMYAIIPPGLVRRTLAPDDINGIKALYPTFRDQRIYDPEWYLLLNPGLVNVIGWDQVMGSIHWLKHGRNDAFCGTPVFDVSYYLKTNPAVAQAIGATNYAEAFWHWRETGLAQGLPSSPVFDATYYMNRYPELHAALGWKNYSAAMVHWLAHGITEGRSAAKTFDPVYYLKANLDVAQAYGATNYKMAVAHWMASGMKEGRKGAP